MSNQHPKRRHRKRRKVSAKSATPTIGQAAPSALSAYRDIPIHIDEYRRSELTPIIPIKDSHITTEDEVLLNQGDWRPLGTVKNGPLASVAVSFLEFPEAIARSPNKPLAPLSKSEAIKMVMQHTGLSLDQVSEDFETARKALSIATEKANEFNSAQKLHTIAAEFFDGKDKPSLEVIDRDNRIIGYRQLSPIKEPAQTGLALHSFVLITIAIVLTVIVAVWWLATH